MLGSGNRRSKTTLLSYSRAELEQIATKSNEILEKARVMEKGGIGSNEALEYFEARGSVAWIGPLLQSPLRRLDAIDSIARIANPQAIPPIFAALETSLAEEFPAGIDTERATARRRAFQMRAVETLESMLTEDLMDEGKLSDLSVGEARLAGVSQESEGPRR